jgi:hypothetical protein
VEHVRPARRSFGGSGSPAAGSSPTATAPGNATHSPGSTARLRSRARHPGRPAQRRPVAAARMLAQGVVPQVEAIDLAGTTRAPVGRDLGPSSLPLGLAPSHDRLRRSPGAGGPPDLARRTPATGSIPRPGVPGIGDTGPGGSACCRRAPAWGRLTCGAADGLAPAGDRIPGPVSSHSDDPEAGARPTIGSRWTRTGRGSGGSGAPCSAEGSRPAEASGEVRRPPGRRSCVQEPVQPPAGSHALRRG